MSMTLADNEVRRYLDAVRSHLDDLSEDDREELLEDLEGHLREVAAEADGTLEERLGPTDVYAEELRTSAGFPRRDDIRAGSVVARVARSRPVRSLGEALASPQARAIKRFVREVEPGWWLLRGYLAVLVPAIITSQGRAADNIPYPHVGSYAFGVVLVVAAVAFSWWIGHHGQQEHASRIVSLVLTGAVVFATVGALTGWRTATFYPYAVADDGGSQPFLTHADGATIANICPYSADGKLLAGVLLFDQLGRPITNTADNMDGQELQQVKPAIANAYPKSIGIVQFGGTYTIAPDGTEQPQNTVTPLRCPASVTAAAPAPAAPSP